MSTEANELPPATIQQKRDELFTRSTRMLDEMTGLASYDALKPKVRAAVGKILDTVVEYIGDAPLYEHQEQSLLNLLTSLTGMFSGTLTRLELSPEDVEHTVRMARENIRKGVLRMIQSRVDAVDAGIPASVKPEDLN